MREAAPELRARAGEDRLPPDLSQGGRAQAWALGSRLDLRRLPAMEISAPGPQLSALPSGGRVAVFRYGAVVFFGAPEAVQVEWIRRLAPAVVAPFDQPERDALEIRVEAGAREGLDERGVLVLEATSPERLEVVAQVLAKSTVLAHYEKRVVEEWTRVEARAHALELRPSRRRSRELLGEIREALSVQVQTVGRVEMTEKPELVWDRPDLDRLYELLAAEFELRERDAALSRKLRLISESASTSLDLIHTLRGIRVEWYIVILIVVEIVLLVYDMAQP